MTTTKEIADSVVQIGARLEQLFKGNNWSTSTPIVHTLGGYTPALSVDSIKRLSETTASRIRTLNKAELSENELSQFLSTVPLQIEALNIQSLQNDADAIVGGAVSLLLLIRSQLPLEPLPSPEVDWEQIKDNTLIPKDLARRLRGVESKLQDIEPRSASLGQKINDIEAAHIAAEQLPTDLADLREKKEHLKQIVEDSGKLGKEIGTLSDKAQGFLEKIQEANKKAGDLIERSEQALRGATGVGLAAAFEKRGKSLNRTGVFWTFCLIAALLGAIYIGSERITALKDVLNSDRSASVIWVNALLAMLGIGAPIWLAWLSTKQIWTNFRLAEDYAFKAAVSKAYEGYRAEAIDIDPNLQLRLFESTLSRFEESPIRLLENDNHSSPLQELLANPTVRKSLESIPGITEKIKALIPNKLPVSQEGSSA